MSEETLRWVGDLSAEQLDELIRSLQPAKPSAGPVDPIVARARPGGRSPLSFGQQQLWLIERIAPGTAVFNLPAALECRGRLDVSALERSLGEVVGRQEVLGARFAMEGDEPVQVVEGSACFALPVYDLAGQPEAEVERLMAEEAARPFDLTTGPLLRAVLLRRGPESHRLVLTQHHIASDAWSIGILVRELGELYAAHAGGFGGRASALPGLRVQYADYAAWQREDLTGEKLADLLGYWRERLADRPAGVELSADHPRPAQQSYRGARVPVDLGARAAAARALGGREGASLFMVLLTVFETLLLRYSGQEDLIVGTPVANRPHASVEGVIGFFVNAVVLRCRLSPDLTFLEALARVREASFDAFAHGEVPFSALVDALQPERDLSRHPLFQLFFATQDPGARQLCLPGVTLTPVDVHPGASQFDLSLLLDEGEERVSGWLEHNPDLFEPATAERLAGHLARLLAGALEAPERRLAELPLLSPVERDQLVSGWNATAGGFDDRPIHRLFAERARRDPGEVAVIHRQVCLSYGELDRRANRLARRLLRLGVAPGDRVGVCVERSATLPEALLGVLKAGAAYLPLDPTYPPARLQAMLEDSAAGVLVATGRSLAGLEGLGAGRTVVRLDAGEGAAESPAEIGEPLADRLGCDGMAYHIYTSGSTGTPKGVMVSHRNVANFFAAMDGIAGGGSARPGTWLAVTSASFDISVLELLWTLTRGFRVVIQEEAVAVRPPTSAAVRPLRFSLFYFADAAPVEGGGSDRYRLLLDGARFADERGFAAVWTPERHFHRFGGLYPNPSVTGAAVAAVTRRVGVRAGSVVLPLHDPLRVAEEWSVVDNLSGGRAGVSIASGWHADDFVLAPQSYERRHQEMVDGIDTVRRLWRGEAVRRLGGAGQEVEVRIQPPPVQAELPLWLTAAGNPRTFHLAGELGTNLLTHLLGQSVEELSGKIAMYREAWRSAGHPGQGLVTVMVHTFVGEDEARVRELVRGPFTGYLKSSAGLLLGLARSLGKGEDLEGLSAADLDALLEHAFERYWQDNALLGTVATCRRMVERLREAGADELACLIDFGVEREATLAALENLDLLRRESAGAAEAGEDFSLPAQITRHGVTHLQCTPSLAGLVAGEPAALAALAGLQKLLLGGEALPEPLAQRLAGLSGGPELWNVYGPTETTVWSLAHRVESVAGRVPIGRPLLNTEAHVLDVQGELLPVGVPGEVFLGGDGVTGGYWRRPELTAERFVPDPWSGRSGARLYRTGDLARRGADGALDYLGRTDHQVKVRGHRIELAEIESCLLAHSGVGEAAVTVRDDGSEGARLVAYVVPAAAAATTGELRRFLAERLPGPMLPADFVTLPLLPRTANGKLDRRALPAPGSDRPGRETPYLAPRTRAEEAVAQIWCDVLGRDRIGVHDNLFRLGADSILSVQIANRASQAGIPITPRHLFQHQTIAELAAAVAPAETRALVAGRRPDPVPLSYAQQRLWFLDQLHPGSSFYTINAAVRLRGPLAVVALGQALAALAERHETLRTRFPTRDGQPVQEILPSIEVPLETCDLCAGAAREAEPRDREAEARARLEAAAGQPFDLARGPLLRTLLVRLEAENHLLLLSLHHIVADGWSMGVLVRELSALYSGFRDGRPSPPSELAALPVQYADYAVWQREWLAGGVLAAQLAYWREELAGPAPVLDLPADRARPLVESFRGAHCPLAVPAAVVERLRALARGHQATLFTVLLAGWETVLHRYTGEDDVVVGTSVANRNPLEVEGLIGFFVNTLVLRTDLGGDPPFGELVMRVRDKMVAAQAHQDVPFDRLVAELQPERGLSGAPFFRLLVESHRFADQGLAIPGMEVDILPRLGGTSIFDLVLSLEERGAGISGDLEYDTDLFDGVRIERMVAHFGTVLACVAEDPAGRLSGLAMLTPAERQVLASWNATSSVYDPSCLPVRFAEQARHSPDAIALVDGERRWSYGSLNGRANRLARWLVRLGVGPERLVGLCLERQGELVAAVLAILKAGGAYLPLDPAYPAERIALLVEDAGVETIVTERRLSGSLGKEGVRLVFLDESEEILARQSESDLDLFATAENLAYVLYTSGSSGRPKGVAVRHRSAAAFLGWALSCLRPEELHGVLASTSISFDISLTEIFVPLSSGGTVILADSAFALAALPARDAVTLVNTVPSIASQLLASGALAPSVCAVSLAGEALGESLVEELYGLPTIGRVLNLYGPTETTVYSTWAVIPRGAPGPPAIGHPLANEQVHLLGAGLQLAPLGVAAEICVGGEGVARGYLRRPDLTAERFVPDAWSGRAGARLYRTGDLGRRRPDGSLDYLGRLDQQVKLHGYRIEPGEIEAALSRHATVRQAVVVAQRHRVGGMRLVAFVVPSAGPAPRAEDLAAFLHAELPSFMVPARFVLLEALPLTPNGKLDRRRLPLPESVVSEGVGRELPRSERERILAAIWRQVLGREEIGIHDNLFRLGGDSILSIQIANRANQAGIAITPRHLFQHQTIAELVAAVPAGGSTVAEQGPVTGAVPLTPIQRWFFEQDFAEPWHWNQAVLLELRRVWPMAVLEEGLGQLLAHHDALRLRFFRDVVAGDPEHGRVRWRQLAVPVKRSVSLPCVDLAALEATAREVERERAMTALHSSLDLSRGPLLRGAVFAVGAGEEPSRQLFLVGHHLAVDGVSWRILLEDLASACDGLAAGEPVRLPAKTLSLRQWSEGLQRHAQSDVLRSELAYWSAAEAVDAPALPVDFVRGANDEASARQVVQWLTAEQTQGLLDLRSTYRLDVEEALLAALAAALAEWSAADRLTIDIEGHGREDLGAAGQADASPSRTVGWFTTLYPLRLELEPGGDLLDTVQAVKEQLRAVPRRGLGYGVLRYLADDSLGVNLRSGRAADISFNYLGQLDHVLGDDPPFALASGSNGPAHSPRARRSHLLEVVAQIDSGRLEVRWTYGLSRHREATVRGLAERFAGGLRELIDGWTACPRTWTAGDFPLSGLTRRELQQSVASLPDAGSDVEDIYALSPAQKGMLFHSLYAPHSGMYVMQLACTLDGELEVDLFRRAWSQTANRFATLRTSFLWEGLDHPVQIVHRDAGSDWTVLDWRSVPAAGQEERLAAFLQADRRRGFDLSQGPLSRLVLIASEACRHRFVWSYHHLLLDGWSTALVWANVVERYEALVADVRENEGESPSYRGYIAWLGDRTGEGEEGFWRRRLAGFSSPTRLSLDRGTADEAREIAGFATLDVRVDLSLHRALLGLARASQLTLHTLLQGAWALLLGHYGGSEDVVFGSVVSGRPPELVGVEAIAGLFVNTLPTRARIVGAEPLLSWLHALQDGEAEMRQYESSSLVDIQEWSDLPAGQPLFETIFSLNSYPVAAALRGEQRYLRFSDITVIDWNNYPLSVAVDADEQLRIEVKFDPRRFEASAIGAALRHYENLLEAIVSRPESVLSDFLAILSEADSRHRRDASAAYQAVVRRRFEQLAGRPQASPHPRPITAGNSGEVA